MNSIRLGSVFLFALLISGYALALDPIYTPWYNNLAIKGYDTVAYFTENAAVEGDEEFEIEWRGAIWRFSSETHMKLFSTEPEKYAPQYGGYCAYAVSQNDTAGIEPQQFKIVNGKLYLNYNKKIQQDWLKDTNNYIDLADKYWPGLLIND